MAKLCNYSKFKVVIGEEKALYISTISDLGGEMLKLDFPMGEYRLYPFKQGYYLSVKDYAPKNEDAIQVFNNRDDQKGFAGTYHDGDTDNVHLLRIFNDYIGEHLSDEWWQNNYYHKWDLDIETDQSETEESEMDESATDESEMDEFYYVSKRKFNRGKVKFIKDTHFIPVFFYLNKQINVDDLSNIELQSATIVKDCGNIEVCWFVIHSTEGRIGIAVKQKKFFSMMFDLPGLCLFSSNGYRAIGNFCCDDNTGFNEDIFERYRKYECEFQPCFCDFEYDIAKNRREYLKYLIDNGIIPNREISKEERYTS